MTSEQRVAILTGAANGIGWALAQKFAQAGYAVCLFDLDGEAAKKRARELAGNHEGFGCDVSDGKQVLHAFAAVDERFGRLDVLVNNAGIVGAQEPRSNRISIILTGLFRSWSTEPFSVRAPHIIRWLPGSRARS